MAKLRILLILMALLTLSLSSGCARSQESKGERRSGRLIVVATLFPLYDFAKNIAGNCADVTLLLPPGMEPHSFEPTPADMLMLNRADIFIYTNRYMEPWAEKLLKGAQSSRLLVLDASHGVRFMDSSIDDDDVNKHGKGSKPGIQGADPHIWLDFSIAQKMVDTIAAAFSAKDPANTDIFTRNAEAYKARLEELDRSYRKRLADCRKKVFISGGHYTFGYLAKSHGLKYSAAYGFSPDAEPTARNLAVITTMLRHEGLDHLFYEELLNPRIADTLAKETGATLLKLHGGHNISKEEFNANRTFIELMERNLDSLSTGLQCQ